MGDFMMLLVGRQCLISLLAQGALIFNCRWRDNRQAAAAVLCDLQIVIDLCAIHQAIFHFGNCKNARCIGKFFVSFTDKTTHHHHWARF